MSFHVPESARWIDAPHGYATTAADGNNGVFRVASPEPGWLLAIVVSDGEGWEHVSVHAYRGVDGPTLRMRTPTWKEMAHVKRLFWDGDDVVMQLYPKEADYVNLHPHTLHWWHPIDAVIPTPPPIMVGPPTEAPLTDDTRVQRAQRVVDAITKGLELGGDTSRVVIRLRYRILGGHVHCRLFTAPGWERTFAKCGDLTFAIKEWPAVCLALEQAAVDIVLDTETEPI